MDTFINILITLIGATVVVGLGTYYYPQIEKMLEEKLQLRLSTTSDNHGILAEIFYKYNHKNSKAWTEWIRTQSNEEQNIAVEQLVNHIEMDPGSWGGITYEAIIALGHFDNKEFIEYFKNLLIRCKKFWKKYKICEKCYEATLISAIKISQEDAMKIFSDEINKLSMESQADPIIKAMQEFSEDIDLGPLIVSILRNEKITYKAKREILNFMTIRSEEKTLQIIIEACDLYLNKKNPFEIDELRLIDDFLQSIFSNLTEEGFKIILKSCNNIHTAAIGVRLTEKAIKANPELFSPEQLYNLMFTQFDKNNIIHISLAEQKNLNNDEKKIIIPNNMEKEFSFSKGPMVEESLETAIEIPAIAKELYDNFRSFSKQASMSQQGACGLLLAGESEFEKLIFARALASERRWKFFYASVEDMLGSSSSSTLRALMERIASSKPCVVFMDGLEIILHKEKDSFSRNLIQALADPMVTLIGAISLNLEADNAGTYVLPEENEVIETLFPKGFSINKPSLAEKNIVLGNILTKLDASRDHQNHEQYKILDPTTSMNLFEFSDYLSNYFKASLLTTGKLMDSKTFLDLEKSKAKY